ncbi:MAG: helix-turn-helix transcriptional regulator [Armatimonadetes bacterium]|nr:helix-turn-helix transcriptional regulator [Armatimonadota bacterium]
MNTSTHNLSVPRPVISRLSDIMSHIPRYSFEGSARLAADTGISRSTIYRLMKGHRGPSATSVRLITDAIRRETKLPIEPWDIFAEDGRFNTKFVCDLFPECRGCMPEVAYDRFGNLTPAFIGIQAGKWVCAQYPYGFGVTMGGQWR